MDRVIMSRLKRRPPVAPTRVQERPDPIADFWLWWRGSCDEIAAAVRIEDSARLETLVAPQLARIHPELEWEISSGEFARMRFTISSAGRPELRATAERWRLAGPADDEKWEFASSRRPDPTSLGPGHYVTAGVHDIEVSKMVAAATVDELHCRLDVCVYHPAFFGIDERDRSHLAFQVLDWSLGEDDVERWLGVVEAVTVAPIDPVPISGFARRVASLTSAWSRDRWAILEGRRGDEPLVVRVRHPLHRVDHPLFEQHVGIEIDLAASAGVTGPMGLPDEATQERMREIAAALTATLEDSAVVAAHEITPASYVLHLYANPSAQVNERVAPVLRERFVDATIMAKLDPAWRAIEHLRP